MPRGTVLITFLLDAPYAACMVIRTRTSEGRQPRSSRFWSRPYECQRMSYWRWLLFAAMARLEVTEVTYLRIPNAKARAIPRDVSLPANMSDRHCSRAKRVNSRILDFLAGMDVMLDLDVSGRKEALAVMAMRIATVHGLKSEFVFRALWRREQAVSTAIGQGVALPHARVSGIDQPILLLARTRQPIVFGAPDGGPVSILLAIVVPEHANDDHLQILALAAERLSSDAFRARLQEATNQSTVKQLFA